MEFVNHHPRIYVIGGKGRSGKDTVASMIKEFYEPSGKSVINLQYASYIKAYAKVISDWDGRDETKPRTLLQHLGTDLIRKQIDPFFFVNRICEDIKVYSYFFDVITISDARAKIELDIPKKQFERITTVSVKRPNFHNGLKEEEQKHFTETDLDDYQKFDYELINDSTIENLRKHVYDMVMEVENEAIK